MKRNREQLADLQNVRIDTSLSKEERIRSYIDQIGDPYHFRVGIAEVRIEYSGGRTMQQILTDMTSQESLQPL